MRQVILHPLIVVHNDGRTNRKWRDCKNRTNHPIRTTEFRMKAHNLYVIVANTLEASKNHLGLKQNGLCIGIKRVRRQTRHRILYFLYLLECRSIAMNTLEIVSLQYLLLELGSCLTNCSEPVHSLESRWNLFQLIIGHVWIGAVETHHVEDVANRVDELI